MKQFRILLVDDDPSIRKFVRANLEARDYHVLLAGDGNSALKIIEEELPDLILLDIMMPGPDGLEVCKKVRAWSNIPIIMLTARDNESDKVEILEQGADDYLTKPFSLRELLARIQAVLRRTHDRKEMFGDLSHYQNGGLKIDFSRQQVTLDGNPVNLTSLEYKILAYLALNAGRVITPNQLLEKIWGEGYSGDYRLLQVNICRLRRKIRDTAKNSKVIKTRPGMGYYAVASK